MNGPSTTPTVFRVGATRIFHRHGQSETTIRHDIEADARRSIAEDGRFRQPVHIEISNRGVLDQARKNELGLDTVLVYECWQWIAEVERTV